MAGANHFKRYGIFEDWFRIKERLAGKKVYLFGLNEDTKKALMFLTKFDVSVIGFLVLERKCGIKYINCPVIYHGDLEEEEKKTNIVLDIYGRQREEIRKELGVEPEVLFQSECKEIVLYGAGRNCEYDLDFFEKCGLNILYIIDQKAENRNRIKFHGIDVISLHTAKEKRKDIPVAITLGDPGLADAIKDELINDGFEYVSVIDKIFLEHTFDRILWLQNGEQNVTAFYPLCLKYIIDRLQKNRRIFLYSRNERCLIDAFHALSMLGIKISGLLSQCEYHSYENNCDIKIRNVFDLCLEENTDFVVWTLNNDESSAKMFVMESGLDENLFLYSSSGPLMLDRSYVLDTHLGFSDSRGKSVKSAGSGERHFKIAILGGSTSDCDLYYEKAWPEYFVELFDGNQFHVECIVAATAGYISAQETISLLRDVIWEKPDIVISFSGINEVFHGEKSHKYANLYQAEIFEKISSHMRQIFFGLDRGKGYSMGRELSDAAEVWLINERMMHAICEELGIQFYSIIQPCIFTGGIENSKREEMMEHIADRSVERIEEEKCFFDTVAREAGKYPWMFDFRGIFDEYDGCPYFDNVHTFEEGSRIIAQKIYSTVIEGRTI